MQRRSHSGSTSKLVKTATVILLLVQVGAALLFLYHALRVISFPYSLDYGEGYLLDQIAHLSNGDNIYRVDLTTPPYVTTIYAPMYLMVQTPLFQLFGPAFWYGRLFSALSVVAAAIFIALTLYTLHKDLSASVIGGLMLFVFPYILHWAPFFRIDSLALGLSCAALFVVVRWPDRRWGLALTAVLLTAAVFTRQTYVLAAPLAAFAWLWRQRSLQQALLLAVLCFTLSLILLIVFQVATGGGFLYNTVTLPNDNLFDLPNVWDSAKDVVKHVPYLILLGGAFFVLGLRARVPAWWLLGPYLIGASLSAATIGKVGSNVNYLFELCAALSLVAGAVLAWQRSQPRLRAALMLLLALQVSAMVYWTLNEGYFNRSMDRVAQRSEIAQLVDIVRESRSPVLADEYMGLIALQGDSLYMEPFLFAQLHAAGIWDETAFVEAIAEKQFGAILIYNGWGEGAIHSRWTDQMLEKIEANYERVATIANTYVYYPQPG